MFMGGVLSTRGAWSQFCSKRSVMNGGGGVPLCQCDPHELWGYPLVPWRAATSDHCLDGSTYDVEFQA